MRKRLLLPSTKTGCLVGILFFGKLLHAQETFPVNGVAEQKQETYAFTGATIVKDAKNSITNGTMVIRNGKIVMVGAGIAIPKDAQVIDCSGKFIYPSFIDMYSDYGIGAPQRSAVTGGINFFTAQFNTNIKGAFGWNQALHTHADASKLFIADDAKAKPLREVGFGVVLTHQKDGIARGTGTAVTLANKRENQVIVKERASAHYSFNKGISTQTYPSSAMGSIALLRQTYLDAQWYKNSPIAEGVNITLKEWNEQQNLPQIFEANDKWAALRADRVGDEFGVQYIFKAGGNEYQRIKEIAATKGSFILPLNFPATMDVEDPADARFVSLSDMKHWELAPGNPAAFEKNNIPFCLTTADLKDIKQLMTNVRKAIEYGLSESKALEALTQTPAQLIGIYDKVGSLEAGKWANFIITSAPVFSEKVTIFQNWIQGEKYAVNETNWNSIAGTYNVAVNGTTYVLDVKSNTAANLIGKDTVSAKFSYDGKMVKIGFTPDKKSKNTIRLSGVNNGNSWNGLGEDSAGNGLLWSATLIKATAPKPDSVKKKAPLVLGKITYPFIPYGWEELPTPQNLLIKNATVWTSEKEGKLEATDVLVKNGKIVQVGKNITDASAKLIDGTGKHLTAGIIDEHSHIAASSINEGGQSVTSEVRIADNLQPDDINIYRQLSGGVTTSHILHGSANTIGGQTQLIKLRWGVTDTAMKFKNWDPFIKFALGENVKRSGNTQGNTRFPNTRMGVEQVLVDAFQRATDYQHALKTGNGKNMRRDLELDALVEIMNKKRFITCHSYVQSEITAAMRVGERFGFTFNTFTHILEGYKVADKMKAHGAAASTFSDWWMYKNEVIDAIPHNPSIMQRMGLIVAINSDDSEMARRLNQEAAKSVMYAGMSEEEALKMVTINPATMLHVGDRTGSIKVGKDADLVLWSDHPLSIYTKAEKTIVDGMIEFDREYDMQLRKKIAEERNRLIQKMIAEKKNGGITVPAQPSMQIMHHCSEHGHKHGLLVIDVE
jgi:imidazolonepropionase-like amidohydrolase